jgi:transcriptional regulator NrdR family protein
MIIGMKCPLCHHDQTMVIDIIDFGLKSDNVHGTFYCAYCDKRFHTKGHIELVETTNE